MLHTTRRFPLAMTASLALLAPDASAQSGCAIELDEVDPFTKDRVLCVAPTIPPAGPVYRWYAVNNTKALKLTWSAPDQAQMVVLPGDALYLLLESDSVVALYSASTEVGECKVDEQGRKCYTGTYTFAVSDSVLTLLEHNWIARMRLHHTNGYQDFVADKVPAWQYGFVNTLGCFRSTCAAQPAQPMPANAVLGQKIVPTSGVVH